MCTHGKKRSGKAIALCETHCEKALYMHLYVPLAPAPKNLLGLAAWGKEDWLVAQDAND